MIDKDILQMPKIKKILVFFFQAEDGIRDAK